MSYIKIFIKEELKVSKQENDLVNSNTEITKYLEKELELLKQELVNKNKLICTHIKINCTHQKYSAMIKITAIAANLILVLNHQL